MGVLFFSASLAYAEGGSSTDFTVQFGSIKVRTPSGSSTDFNVISGLTDIAVHGSSTDFQVTPLAPIAVTSSEDTESSDTSGTTGGGGGGHRGSRTPPEFTGQWSATSDVQEETPKLESPRLAAPETNEEIPTPLVQSPLTATVTTSMQPLTSTQEDVKDTLQGSLAFHMEQTVEQEIIMTDPAPLIPLTLNQGTIVRSDQAIITGIAEPFADVHYFFEKSTEDTPQMPQTHATTLLPTSPLLALHDTQSGFQEHFNTVRVMRTKADDRGFFKIAIPSILPAGSYIAHILQRSQEGVVSQDVAMTFILVEAEGRESLHKAPSVVSPSLPSIVSLFLILCLLILLLILAHKQHVEKSRNDSP